MQFLVEYWQKYKFSQFCNLDLYVTNKSKCYLYSPSAVLLDIVIFREVPSLNCTHEEADTRLLLDAHHAALTHTQVMVQSSDMDVLVLLVGLHSQIDCTLFMLSGVGNKKRTINVSSIANTLGEYAVL